MSDHASADSNFVMPAQLCVGMHVHLDLPWTEHPFTFSSFKIKSADQIEALRSMGLGRVRYNPAKSDAKPLPAPTDGGSQALPPQSHEDSAFYRAKRARIERLTAQQSRVAQCESQFLSSTRSVKDINKNIFANPERARQGAETLVQAMADSMLTEADIAINLMKDSAAGEDVYFHSLNVALLSMMLAKELKAPTAAIQRLGMGAMFHDVGKVDIPDRITRKGDALTAAELSLLQQHCAYGVETGRKLGLPKEALMVIAQHHELMDGSGYPGGLKGNDFAMLARIVSIANAYDNLCNPVKISTALTPHQALALMYAHQRDRFDPTALATFVRCMGIYPPGTIVALSNESLGMVVSVNSAKPLKPMVLVYDSLVPREQAVLVELESEPDVTIVRAIAPDQLPKPLYDYFSPRRRVTYYFDAPPSAGKAAA